MNWEEKWCKLDDIYTKRKKKMNKLILKHGDKYHIKLVNDHLVHCQRNIHKEIESKKWLKRNLTEKEHDQMLRWIELNKKNRYNVGMLDEKYNK